MYLDLMIAGSGGQGILLAGKLLAWAGLLEGMHVTWFPSYGAEMRGGTANCTVIISDEVIGSPIVQNPGNFIIMNNASFERFEKRVKTQGTVFLNSSLVKKEGQGKDIEIVRIPANEIAEEIGDVRVANMVMVGALIGETEAMSLEVVKEAIKRVIPENKSALIVFNKKGLEAGYLYKKSIPVLS